jgi:hypothetical protein
MNSRRFIRSPQAGIGVDCSSEASELAKVVESYASTLQAVAFEERLAKLEQRIRSERAITSSTSTTGDWLVSNNAPGKLALSPSPHKELLFVIS